MKSTDKGASDFLSNLAACREAVLREEKRLINLQFPLSYR